MTIEPDAALLPCPGCGGKAHWPEPEVGMNWVGCTECGAWTALDEAAWNRRAGQAHERRADAGLLAALEEARATFQHYGDLHAASLTKPAHLKENNND